MAFYDTLKLAGWEPFLDQYDLVPGSNLETSLAENLEASSSGVILWSSHTKDSEWCKRERQAMATLKNERGNGPHPFHFVFAKLDSEPLPLFAKADLYIDFNEYYDGPWGVNLLKLICGLRGVSLPPEAVGMAQKVDEDAQALIIAIRGAMEANNPVRLKEIGTGAEPGAMSTPGPLLEAVQGLISMNKNEDALEVLERFFSFFSKSLRASQLKGLALRRLGRYQEAVNILSELKVAGHQDPETLGILAASWDGLYRETGNVQNLRTSREIYRMAFQGDSKDYYTGINAASKSLFLGEPREAERLAAQVLPLVESAKDGKDFWAACTLAEVYLLQRDLETATAQFQKAMDMHPGKSGDLKSTQKQAERICNTLGLTEEEKRKVMWVFEEEEKHQ